MALQTSGAISLQQVNVELGNTTTATISLNDAAVRKLLGKASGTISIQDAYGKANEIRFVSTISRTGVDIYQLMGSPTAVGNYVFENNANIEATTAYYSLRTGVFPAGSTLTIVNNGYIYGIGGSGSSVVNTPGGAGGDAIILDMPCQIDNSNGYIFAGGGGGGSSQLVASLNSDYYVMAGGGGGAGSSAGAAGTNAHNKSTVNNPVSSSTAPKVGTATAGGAGGSMGVSYSDTGNDIAYGGAGGANGAAGAVGSTTQGTDTYKDTPTIGVAGAAGRAIITNGKTLTKIAGFDSIRVKGAIV